MAEVEWLETKDGIYELKVNEDNQVKFFGPGGFRYIHTADLPAEVRMALQRVALGEKA